MPSNEVGQALALLRTEKGLSQRELAGRMGLARDTSISSIETGNPTARVISSYLTALGLDYHALARALDLVDARASALEAGEIREPAESDPLDVKVRALIDSLQDMVAEVKSRDRKP